MTKITTISKAIEAASAGLTLTSQHETDGRLGILVESALAEAISLLQQTILQHGELRADSSTPEERVRGYADHTIEMCRE